MNIEATDAAALVRPAVSGNRLSTLDVVDALRARYPLGEWAFFTEVPNGTGSNKDRSCDAIAMNLYPSKGLAIHGHEIKVSRSDWQKEIQDPSKAEAFAKFCDYWWIVAPANVLKVEELPSNWGWICPTDSGNARVRKPATKREPQPIDRDFLAGMLRSASKADVCQRMLRDARQKEYQRGFDAGREREASRRPDDYEKAQLQRRVKELEAAAGHYAEFCECGDVAKRRLDNTRYYAQTLIDSLSKLVELSGQVELAIKPSPEAR